MNQHLQIFSSESELSFYRLLILPAIVTAKRASLYTAFFVLCANPHNMQRQRWGNMILQWGEMELIRIML